MKSVCDQTDFQEMLAISNGNWTSYTHYTRTLRIPNIMDRTYHLLRDHDRAYFKGTVSQDGYFSKVHKSMHCGTSHV